MSELTFVHLSDTHIGPKGRLQYGTDTAAKLRQAAQHIETMALAPICVIISGDLSDHGELESYQHIHAVLAESFGPFGVPVLLTLGNHDLRLPFRHVFLHDMSTTDEALPWYYSRELHGIRFIMLDSKLPGEIHGELDAPQLAWLETELQQPAPIGHIVVVHHPSVPRGVPRPDDYLLANREDFGHILRRYPSVLGVLCGHSHVSTAAAFGGTLHVAAPATAYLFDPSLRQGSRGLDGCGFNICTVREGRLIVNPVILPGEQRELYHRA
ncbi:MAG: metallophosphoesterase [Candidatus Tectimicrobiota bacterium]